MPRRRRSFFDIFEDLFEEMEELRRRIEEEFFRFAIPEELKEERFGPLLYGVRIEIGPDGIPKIQEFGNVKRVGVRPKISEEREPLVDVYEEEDKIVVVAEMPGVERDKISVKATENKVTIRASNEQRRYYKEIELPKPVKPETAKAQYRNGVLEVKVEKQVKEKKEEGIDIRVE
uniref:Hsp20/alpha crystallin family protein n=1 Tax=Fervidicoccus fontis TaxID=683846 RepID=A0A7J3ZIG7_9CREN